MHSTALTDEERKLLRASCTERLHGFDEADPASEFRQIADWCEANGIEHDRYGDGKLIGEFESKIANLLGKAAAAFMPSGTMAQLTALRIWTERCHLKRFGMHLSCHLHKHEEQAYQALLGLHGVLVGEAHRPINAVDLANIAEPLACLIVELPMREIGGQLLTWEELETLKAAAHARSVALHMDGARLWESRAFYGHSYQEIAEGFDSVYVSVYKGVGGIAGALLVGEKDFIASAKLWRRRMGGTLIHQSPMVASAAMRFDARLSVLDACYARTVALAKVLNAVPGVRTLPTVPQCNLLHIFFDAPEETVMRARDDLARTEKCWLFGQASPADVPGWSRTELYVGDALLSISDDRILPLFKQLMAQAAR
jgi:threonine aldolase